MLAFYVNKLSEKAEREAWIAAELYNQDYE